MNLYITAIILLCSSIFAQELKIKANSFSADENSGISVFNGDVNVIKKNDELNASEVTIYTDKSNQPTKFVAVGSVSFKIQTKKSIKYEGSAEKVIYLPSEKKYTFYDNVHLKQIGEKKEILGDEVVLDIVEGKAYAKGLKKGPVIMIFDIADEKE